MRHYRHIAQSGENFLARRILNAVRFCLTGTDGNGPLFFFLATYIEILGVSICAGLLHLIY